MKTFIRILILNALIIGVGQFLIPSATTYASPSAEAFSFSSAPNITIGNWSTITDSITVDSIIGINDLNVYVRANHTTVGDLIISLSHGDTTITLMDRPGVPTSSRGCRKDHMEATFDDSSSRPVETECAGSGYAIAGSVRPDDNLSVFNGSVAQGEWVITISDNNGNDTGTFYSWSLEIDGVSYDPEVSGGSVSAYGCSSGALTLNFSVTTPPGTYRYVAGAWMLDQTSSGVQTGSHIMWREWTASNAGGTTTVSLPITETFDSTSMGMTYYPKSWQAAFGGNSISPNTHLRVFYQVWSTDFGIQYGSGVVTVPNCAG